MIPFNSLYLHLDMLNNLEYGICLNPSIFQVIKNMDRCFFVAKVCPVLMTKTAVKKNPKATVHDITNTCKLYSLLLLTGAQRSDR